MSQSDISLLRGLNGVMPHKYVAYFSAYFSGKVQRKTTQRGREARTCSDPSVFYKLQNLENSLC